MLGTLNRKQIDQLLRQHHLGRIGCHDKGRTYIVPITYVYEDGIVYAHSAEGMKLQMMRASPEVCFEVDHVVDMANWKSVVAWGTFEQLRGDEARAAMALLVGRLLPVVTSQTARLTHSLGVDEMRLARVRGRKAVPFRIQLTERTGRFEQTEVRE